MSALPPKADIGSKSQEVRFVPKADIDLGRPVAWLAPPARSYFDPAVARRSAIFFWMRLLSGEFEKENQVVPIEHVR